MTDFAYVAEGTGKIGAFFSSQRNRLIPGVKTLAAMLALALGCTHQGSGTPDKKAVEVVVTTPIHHEVTDFQDFTGRLEGLKTVEVRARVSGFVAEAPFKEGDLVREGDVLFRIDPRLYQATLDQMTANLKQAEADRNLQEKNVYRAKQLIRTGSIAREDYDQIAATSEKSLATVGAMKSSRDLAQLYVDYTRVTAPLAGRVSRRYVDPGNLVNADNTTLTTIVSDNQVYAYFDVDERTYLNLVGQAAPGKTSWFSGLQFPVLMRLANEDQFTRSGIINFVDNRVNASTGTIRMRGVFDNPSGTLKSGLFVRIRLPIGKPYQAVLISDEALLSDQGKRYVYVLNDKDEVVYRPVTLGQEIQGLRVIKSGLVEKDRVVVSGMQRVRPGLQVQPEVQAPPKPPDSVLGRLLTSRYPEQKSHEASAAK